MRRFVLIAVVLVVAAGCNESRIDPGADVSIGGAVLGSSGEAVTGARVALMREADAFDVFSGVISIGLTCLEAELSECGESRITTTGPDGGFAYQLQGRDTQGRLGTASIMELTTALDREDGELAGPGVSTRFQVQSEQVRIPLRLWRPEVGLVGAGARVRATWTEPGPDVFPSAADLGAMERWVVFQASPEEDVWRATTGPGALELDARILEDSRGGLQVFATVGDIKTTPEAGTDVEVLLRSSRVPYASTAGAPPSRGKACFVADASGRAVSQAGCPLTDGDFSDEFRPASCPRGDDACNEPHHDKVWVDLGSAQDVTLVVVRGCSGACTVEASGDGRTWQPVGASPDGPGPRDLAVSPSGPVKARYVRVSASGGVETLRELSVWDGRPVSVQGSLRVEPAEVDGALVPGAPGAGGSRGWLIAVAVGAGLLALVAVLIVRRRRAAAA